MVPSGVLRGVRSAGASLAAGIRGDMESRLGHDFSQVRVHTESPAARSADAIGALAYTVGHDIVFAPGAYAPYNAEGKRLLIHELTHVVQQSGAAPPGTAPAIHISQDAAAEREAGSVADGGSAADMLAQGGGVVGTRGAFQGGRHEVATVSVRSPVAVQRQPASPQAASSAWSTLPSDARQAVRQSIFDGFSPAQQAAFRRVYAALKQAGYWGAVLDVRYVNVEFHQIDAIVSMDLEARLLADVHFCADRGLTNIFHKGMSSFRQVTRPGTEALHISIKSDGSATLHLDTVSPVVGRRQSGECAISLGLGLEHYLRDVKHYQGELPRAPEPGELPF
jgi:Domain of unknown function (DUF4157)